MGQILYHTALLAPSLQDADPWFYQADALVLSMDLTAGRTWDQSTPRQLRVEETLESWLVQFRIILR